MDRHRFIIDFHATNRINLHYHLSFRTFSSRSKTLDLPLLNKRSGKEGGNFRNCHKLEVKRLEAIEIIHLPG
jgi:hypothetical protein